VPDDRVVKAEPTFLDQLHDDDRRERLADGPDLEKGVRPDWSPARHFGVTVDAVDQVTIAIRHGEDQAGDGAVRPQVGDVAVDRRDGGIKHLAMMRRAGVDRVLHRRRRDSPG
jgi:hypothetical protein